MDRDGQDATWQRTNHIAVCFLYLYSYRRSKCGKTLYALNINTNNKWIFCEI